MIHGIIYAIVVSFLAVLCSPLFTSIYKDSGLRRRLLSHILFIPVYAIAGIFLLVDSDLSTRGSDFRYGLSLFNGLFLYFVIFFVYESHQDSVIEPPSNIDILAYNNYGLQSFSFSDYIYGVQFHPEFNFNIMQAYHKIRTDKLEGKSMYSVKDKNEGIKVINNFIKLNLKGN